MILFEQEPSTHQYFLYKKNRKEIIPVKEKEVNELAKNKLSRFFENKEKLKIPSRYLQQWEKVALFHTKGNVEKANAILIPTEKSAFSLNNMLNDLTAKEWLPETISVFNQKGLGANHKDAQIEKQHPAPFSFQDVSRLIQFYTKENAKVLDPFSGVASTVKACAYTQRIGYGVELNKKYHQLGLTRLNNEIPANFIHKNKQQLIQGDSLQVIQQFENNFFDFIITSPPYWNILETVDHKSKARIQDGLDYKYSEQKNDLANIEEYETFLATLTDFFSNCARILKPKKYLCVIVSDFRKKEKYYIFHADLAKRLEKKGNFCLKGIRILYQKHKSIFPYGYPFSFVPNFHHQNVLIFQNIKSC